MTTSQQQLKVLTVVDLVETRELLIREASYYSSMSFDFAQKRAEIAQQRIEQVEEHINSIMRTPRCVRA